MNPCHICNARYPEPHGMSCSAAWGSEASMDREDRIQLLARMAEDYLALHNGVYSEDRRTLWHFIDHIAVKWNIRNPFRLHQDKEMACAWTSLVEKVTEAGGVAAWLADPKNHPTPPFRFDSSNSISIDEVIHQMPQYRTPLMNEGTHTKENNGEESQEE